jgi:hypothetical protein
MKNLIFLICLLFSLPSLQAQNWNPLGPNDLYVSDTIIENYAPYGPWLGYSDSGHVFAFSLNKFSDPQKKFSFRKWDGKNWQAFSKEGLLWVSDYPTYYGKFALNRATDQVYYFTRDFAQVNRGTVLTYNGSKWVAVGQPGFTPGGCTPTSLALDHNGYPWVAFRDSSYNLFIMRFDGVSWAMVGSTPVTSNISSYEVSLAINSSNTPYVGYLGYASSPIIKTFDGTAWASLPALPATSTGLGSLVISPINDSVFVSVGNSGSNGWLSYKLNGSSWLQMGTASGNSYGKSWGFSSDGTLFRQGSYYVQKLVGNSWINTTVGVSDPLAPGPAAKFATLGSIGTGSAVGGIIAYTSDGNVKTALIPHGFTDSVASQTTTAIDSNGTVYTVYRDPFQNWKASCKKYVGNSWVYVGTPGFSAGNVGYLNSTIDKFNNLYVAYSDSANQNKATVMKYDGVSWALVGSGGISPANIIGLSMAMDSAAIPYVVFVTRATPTATTSNLTVKKFTGSAWVIVGPAVISNQGGSLWHISFDRNNVPFIAGNGAAKLLVKKFNGTGWVNQGVISNPNMYGKYVKLGFDGAGNTILFCTNSSPGYAYNGMYLKKRLAGAWTDAAPYIYEQDGDMVMRGDTIYRVRSNRINDHPYGPNIVVEKYVGGSWVQVGEEIRAQSPKQIRMSSRGDKAVVSYISDVPSANDDLFVKEFNFKPSPLPLPHNQSVCTGSSPVFVSAVASAATYQWQLNDGSGWVNVTNGPGYSGATDDSLVVSNASPSLNGFLYRCISSSGAVADTGSQALLKVGDPAYLSAKIFTSPSSICYGDPLFLTANITGGTNTDYIWKRNSVLWGSNISVSMGGNYDYSPSILRHGDTISLIASSDNACTYPDTTIYIATVNPLIYTGIHTPITQNCGASALTLSSPAPAQKLEWMLGSQVFFSAEAGWGDTASHFAGGPAAGAGLSELNNPLALSTTFIDYNNITTYVADRLNQRVLKYTNGSSTGIVVAGGNGTGAAPNKLRSPSGVFVDNGGNVYVADALNNRIQKWAPGASSGTTVAGGNGAGTAANQLDYPVGVYVNKNGVVFVCDQGNNRIQRWLKGATSGVTIAGAASGVSGSAANRLNKPGGFFVDSLSAVYVADMLNHRIVKWAAGATAGVTVAGGTGSGSTLDKLDHPSGVFKIENGSGDLIITDQANNRILKWKENSSAGVVIAGGNGSGSGNDQFNKPAAAILDVAGNLYVADQLNNRIQKYKPSIDFPAATGAQGLYSIMSTSFNGCKLQSQPYYMYSYQSAQTNLVASFNQFDGSEITYIGVGCKTLATITDAPSGNVPGMTTVTLKRGANTTVFHGKPYLRRHYEIIPASDGPAVIKFYMPQDDFDSYNAYLSSHSMTYNALPANTTDVIGASHIAITEFLGTPSSGTSGPAGIYDTMQRLLIPPSDITTVFDIYLDSWVISFPVTNISGGFYIHSNSLALRGSETSLASLQNEESGFTAFPNPATSMVTVETSFAKGQVQLLDVSGRVQLETLIDGKTNIDLTAISPGIYFLRYIGSEKTATIRLIKE